MQRASGQQFLHAAERGTAGPPAVELELRPDFIPVDSQGVNGRPVIGPGHIRGSCQSRRFHPVAEESAGWIPHAPVSWPQSGNERRIASPVVAQRRPPVAVDPATDLYLHAGQVTRVPPRSYRTPSNEAGFRRGRSTSSRAPG